MFKRGHRTNFDFPDGSQYQLIVETTNKTLATSILTEWLAAQGVTAPKLQLVA